MLKYYTAERARHADVQAVNLTFPQVKLLIDMLCDKFGLPHLAVVLRSKGRSSHFKPYDRSRKGPAIKMLPSMLQARTACHEFAHYAHFLEYKNTTQRWVVHGHEHRVWMDKSVEFAKSTILYQSAKNAIQEKRLDTLKQVVVSQLKIKNQSLAADTNPVGPVQAAFNALPEVLHCPKCSCHKAKAQFGVRVMARDAANQPTKIVRQSYCRECR